MVFVGCQAGCSKQEWVVLWGLLWQIHLKEIKIEEALAWGLS
jgi:hypothetical protein